MQNAIIIFVRNPEHGKVKTRLADSIGATKALQVYEMLLQKTKEVVEEVHADKFIFYYNNINTNDIWNDYLKLVQIDGDLGEKMQDAFTKVFNLGYNKVCIIGSDCYDITTEIIRTAFHQIESNQIVIGPANDGGYYLLGMGKNYPFLFQNKQWSTNSVYSATLEDCTKNKLEVFILPKLIDIDTIEDLQQTALKEML